MLMALVVLLILIFIPVLITLGLVAEKRINRLIRVEKKKLSETSAKHIDRWGKGIILVIALTTLPFILKMDIKNMKWYWIGYFMLSLGFQSFLERMYLKESKQYITTLIFLILAIIGIYFIDYFIR